MVLAHSSESGNLVTKKYIEEEKKLVESGATQDDTNNSGMKIRLMFGQKNLNPYKIWLLGY
jgi:hypothetical protein